MLFILRYLTGYMYIEATSNRPEHLINLIIKSGINIWGTKKERGCFFAKISLPQYNFLQSLIQKKDNDIKIKIIKQYGLPYLIKKYRKRLGILVGIILFFVIIHVLSLYIWNITIDGNTNIPSEEIYQTITELGVTPGTLKMSLSIPYLEHCIMLKLNNLSWISINLQGSTAKIKLKEKSDPPNVLLDDTPCDIKAKQDGQIIMLQVYKGSAQVKNGDSVLKDQLIVSNITELPNGKTLVQKADARVIAKTQHEFKEYIDLTQNIFCQTGKKVSIKTMQLFGLKIPLSLAKAPHSENYKLESTTKLFKIANIVMPISISIDNWLELSPQIENISVDTAKELMKEKINLFKEKTLKDSHILSETRIDNLINNKYHTEIIFYCHEDIATPVPLCN